MKSIKYRPQMLALFDVLGFGERTRTDSLKALVAAYEQLTSIVNEKRDSLIIDASEVVGFSSEGYPISTPSIRALVVEHAYFSDTIIMWGWFDRPRFWTFCDICAEFFCEIVNIGMQARGAISVGEAHLDKKSNTFLGYPLVEADRVEKAQEWIGISFGPSFAEKPFTYCLRDEQVIHYKHHQKPGEAKWITGITLDWPRQWRKKYNRSLCKYLQSLNTNDKYSSYYQRTIEYAELSARREARSP